MNIGCDNNKRILGVTMLNVFLPLFIGLLIYLFVNKRAYISGIVNIPVNLNLEGITGAFIKCWLADMLWSYAMTFSLALVLKPFHKRVLISAVLTIFLGSFLEFLQFLNVITGTSDFWDVVFEITAVLIAVFVIKRRKTIWKKQYRLF